MTPEQMAEAVLLEYEVTRDDGGDLTMLIADAIRQGQEEACDSLRESLRQEGIL